MQQGGISMTQPERRDASMPYISDDAVMEEQRRCRRSFSGLILPIALTLKAWPPS